MKKFLLFLVLFLACSAVPNFTEEITEEEFNIDEDEEDK